MRRSTVFCFLIALSTFSLVKAQHVYPEVFDNCYLDEFKFEETTIIAEMESDNLKEIITTGWDSKMLKGAEGYLGLQILVDKKGTSCLMSVKNDTNLKMKKMNLEENINNNLQWKSHSDKISAILLLEFKKGEMTVKRLGTTDMRTLTEIKN